VLQGAEGQGSVVGVLVGEKCVIADPAMVCWRRSPPCRPPSSPAAALPRRLCPARHLRRRLCTWAAVVSASRAMVDPRGEQHYNSQKSIMLSANYKWDENKTDQDGNRIMLCMDELN